MDIFASPVAGDKRKREGDTAGHSSNKKPGGGKREVEEEDDNWGNAAAEVDEAAGDTSWEDVLRMAREEQERAKSSSKETTAAGESQNIEAGMQLEMDLKLFLCSFQIVKGSGTLTRMWVDEHTGELHLKVNRTGFGHATVQNASLFKVLRAGPHIVVNTEDLVQAVSAIAGCGKTLVMDAVSTDKVMLKCGRTSVMVTPVVEDEEDCVENVSKPLLAVAAPREHVAAAFKKHGEYVRLTIAKGAETVELSSSKNALEIARGFDATVKPLCPTGKLSDEETEMKANGARLFINTKNLTGAASFRGTLTEIVICESTLCFRDTTDDNSVRVEIHVPVLDEAIAKGYQSLRI